MVLAFIAGIYVVLPAVVIWGWVRWARRRSEIRGWPAKLSLAGFSLATLAGALALTGGIYARAIGGFGQGSAAGFALFAGGLLFSLVALALACAGVWRRGLLQWHALYAALAVLVFWLSAIVAR